MYGIIFFLRLKSNFSWNITAKDPKPSQITKFHKLLKHLYSTSQSVYA